MSESRPNLLLVTTDQQRHDTTGPDSPEYLRTPHADLLRRQGIRFESAYSSCPLCVPSRTSIMTGQSVFSHGMAENGRTSDAMGRDRTLPARLRDLGYQTAAIGKMHFTPPRVRHGFDEMILPRDYYREMRRSGEPRQPMRHGLGQNELSPSRATVPEGRTLTDWIAERCAEYVRERRDPSLPFFLWCSFSKPHPPLDPPEPYYSMYRDRDLPEPVVGDWADDGSCPEAIKRRPWMGYHEDFGAISRETRAAYYGLITHVDHALGRVFGALGEAGAFENTVIAFTSDHGEYLGDHGLTNKTFFHDVSARVPFLLRLPDGWGDRRPRTTVTDPVQLADVLPTMVAAAGGEIPDETDGQDLVALARGELDDPRRYAEGMSATVSSCDYLGITDGEWKYIWYPYDEVEHLFDLREDPYEERNLADDPSVADERADLRRAMVDRHRDRGSPYVDDDGLLTVSSLTPPTEDPRDTVWEGFATDYDTDSTVRRH